MFQLHLLERVLETFLHEPPPLAPPWELCRQTTSPECSRFPYSKGSGCTNAKEGTVEAQGSSQADGVHQFQLQSSMEPKHSVETVVPVSFSCSFFRIRGFIATDTVRWQERVSSPIPTLPTPLHDSNPCLVNCTVARSLHAASTLVVCELRQKAR